MRTETQRCFLSPFLRMDSDGARLVQALGDHHIAEGAIQSGHLNHIKALIRPVDVSCREEKEREGGNNDALTDPEYVIHIK